YPYECGKSAVVRTAFHSMGGSPASTRRRRSAGRDRLTDLTSSSRPLYSGESHTKNCVVFRQMRRSESSGTFSPAMYRSSSGWYRELPDSTKMSLTDEA